MSDMTTQELLDLLAAGGTGPCVLFRSESDAIATRLKALEEMREKFESEVVYCQGWADHYRDSEPMRSKRHQERADRLRAILDVAREVEK